MTRKKFTVQWSASGLHFFFSFIIVIICAVIVFAYWYPYPFNKIAEVGDIFIVFVVASFICGPLLTLVVYSPKKTKLEFGLDIVVIIILQLAAVFYGLFVLAQGRPVWVAFEGDRFRIVSAVDVDYVDIDKADKKFRSLSFKGPVLIGVRLLKDFDDGFKESVIASVNGHHPAFRPGRWVDYKSQSALVVKSLRPLDNIHIKSPKEQLIFNNAVSETGLYMGEIGYLPLVSEKTDEWTMLIDKKTGVPHGYMPISGWQ